MTNPFDDDTVITRIVRNPFDFGSTYITLTYGKEEEDSYVLNKDSDNELKKYLKIFLVLATSVAEEQILEEGKPKNILNHNLEFLYSDEDPTTINIKEFSEFVKGLCNKVKPHIDIPASKVPTDTVGEEGESCPVVEVSDKNIKIGEETYTYTEKDRKNIREKIKGLIEEAERKKREAAEREEAAKRKGAAEREDAAKIEDVSQINCAEQVQEKINKSCAQEVNRPPSIFCETPFLVVGGGGRKIKTQKGNKSRNANKSKNKISRKHRTKKNSQKGGGDLPPPPLPPPSPPKVIKVHQRVEKTIEEVLPPRASVRNNNYTVDGVRLPLYCINIKDIPKRNRRKAPASIYRNFMDFGNKFFLKKTCCVYRRNFNLTEWKFDEKKGEDKICMNEARGKYGTCPQHTCFSCGFPKYRHSKYCDFCILGSTGGLKHVDGLLSRIFKHRYPFRDTLRHTQEYYSKIRYNLQYYINTKKKPFTVSTSSLPAPPPENFFPPLPAPPGRGGVSASIKTPEQGLFDELNSMPIGEGICERVGRGGTCTYNNLKGYKYCNMHLCGLNLLGEGGNIGGEIFRCSEVKASTERYCAAHKEALDRRNDSKHVQEVFSTFKHYEGLRLSEFIRSEARGGEGVTGPKVENRLTLADFKTKFPDNKYEGDPKQKAKELFTTYYGVAPTYESPPYPPPLSDRAGGGDGAVPLVSQPVYEELPVETSAVPGYPIAGHIERDGPSRKAPPPPIIKVADNYFIINHKLCKYIPGEGVKHELNILKSLKNKLEFYTNTNNDKNLTEILLLPEIVEGSDLDSTQNISKPDKAVIRSFMGDGIYTKLKYSENFLDKNEFISLDEIIQNRDDGILAKFFTDRFNAFTYISADPAFYLQFKYEDQPFQNIKLFIILLLVIMRKLYQVSLFVHGNLNASNIMISLEEPKFYIINFEYSAIINNTAESTAPMAGEELKLGDVNLIHSHLTEYPGFKEIFDYLSAERKNVGVSYFTDIDVKIGATLGDNYLNPTVDMEKIAFKNYVIHLTDVYLILFGNQGRYQGDITIFNEILENIRCFLIRTITTAGGPSSKDPVFTEEMEDTFKESHRVSEPYISRNVIKAAFSCFANRY